MIKANELRVKNKMLFQRHNSNTVLAAVSFGIDVKEAPEGFYAVSKKEAITPNVCNSCDAKKLCQQNNNDWCLKNRCMSYEIRLKDGSTLTRKDGQSVIFKTLVAK